MTAAAFRQFFELAARVLKVNSHQLVNALGLCEVNAVYLDDVRASPGSSWHARHKTAPPWTRVTIVDPETLQPVPPGQTGLIRHHCLANVSTVLAIQTDDLGVWRGDGFEILGRAQGAASKGCSISVDDLLIQERAAQ